MHGCGNCDSNDRRIALRIYRMLSTGEQELVVDSMLK